MARPKKIVETIQPPTHIATGQHGGSREGSGRKAGTKIADNNAYTVLANAKAKRENFKARLTEIEYRERVGELYHRDEILSTISTVVAVFTEQMRSLPDKLERQAGLTPSQAEMAEDEINTQLEDLRFKLLSVLDGKNGNNG